MVRWWRRPDVDLQKFFEALPTAFVGRGYSREDRYRDFRAVFNTDAGRRVLAQIVREAEGLPVSRRDAADHAGLAYGAGKRWMGQWIVKAINELGSDIVIDRGDQDGNS